MTTMVNTRLKSDDEVLVIAGRDKGLRGKVIRIFPRQGRVLVSRVNMVKRHAKASQNSAAGIVEKESPLSLSNVQYYCPACKTGVRLGVKTLEDGRKVRTCRKCSEVLDR